MVFWCRAGTTGAVDDDFFFRIKGFEHHGIGDDADVGAQAHEDQPVVVTDFVDQGRAAEGWLFQYRCPHGVGQELFADAPASRVFDTVRNREFSAFLGFAVIFAVCILREDEVRFLVFIFLAGDDLRFYLRDDGLCLGVAEGAVDEIILHIDDDISLGHCGHPSCLGT